ncbi:unnamed protein product [Ranitomeya imitator]|uniref:Reverse transcriptase domain-containing protein n=1 Tax=Ranitomeya imitator TaxID=111125 RepID=A0ABN9MA40_9NEOB|nr:unnamed protein product [Ranitomeya imitator]
MGGTRPIRSRDVIPQVLKALILNKEACRTPVTRGDVPGAAGEVNITIFFILILYFTPPIPIPNTTKISDLGIGIPIPQVSADTRYLRYRNAQHYWTTLLRNPVCYAGNRHICLFVTSDKKFVILSEDFGLNIQYMNMGAVILPELLFKGNLSPRFFNESSEIISQVTTPGSFLHTPSEELRTRDFERDLRRFTALDLHLITLAEYHKVQRIPRGLRVPLRPTLFQENTDYCVKFESILNKCSMDLIVLTIDFLQKEISELKKKISTSEQQLIETSSSEDFKALKTKLDNTISEFRNNLQEKKRVKFLRDADDYRNNQVYLWRSTGSFRRPRTFQRSFSSISNSSDSDFGPSRGSFLEGRRARKYRGRRGGEGGNMDRQRMTTRSQVDQELHRFFRTLRLKVHFSNTPFETTPDLTKTLSGFSLKSLGLRTSSSFQPPKTYHPVETFIEVVNRDVKEILGSIDKGLVKVKNNLSREEYRSLMDLKNNRNLIIKPADKGGAIVVLDRTYYINEILSQLNDTNTYMPVSNNPTFEIGRQISNLVSHYLSLGVIDQKLGDFLINHHPVIPVLYTLPKIHKDLLRPPGRPIVASTNSVLSPLAITVEKILSPLVPFMKSYLKDTTHFLQLLRDLGPLPSNSILVTMDVSSLYTNIDHQEGLESVTKYVTTYANFSDNQLQFCIDALTIILTKNYFLFEDQFYVQKKGTAMGSNVAPPFANIFMDFYETSYVYCHPLFSSNVIFWRRFIDDVFFIWTGDAEALRGFHADLNSSTPNITFSLQYSDQSINFLDTLIIIRSGGIVETDLYVKSTDRNSLLSYTSNHPRHVKKALPKSQHDRIRRIVSNPVQRTMRHMEMDRKFHDRGYPPTLDGNIGAQNINVTATPKQPRIAFVSVFHPFKQQIQQCILKHWNIVQNSYPTIPEFNTRPIFCDKRSDNLRNYLVRADIGSSRPSIKQRVLSTPRNGTFPCLGCLQCSNVTKGDSFTHPRSGHRFPIKGHFTCDSSFVIQWGKKVFSQSAIVQVPPLKKMRGVCNLHHR